MFDITSLLNHNQEITAAYLEWCRQGFAVAMVMHPATIAINTVIVMSGPKLRADNAYQLFIANSTLGVDPTQQD